MWYAGAALKTQSSSKKTKAAAGKSKAASKSKAAAAATPKLKKKQAARQAREDMLAKQRQGAEPPDPFSRANLKKMAVRIGIPLTVGWGVAVAIPGMIPIIVAGVLTLVLAGIVFWVVRFTKKQTAVAGIIRDADTAEARREAIEKLDTEFKQGDMNATLAKAQLLMQEDPREALRTLESLELKKMMVQNADQCRSQRSMIHLMLGETDSARTLADEIDLSRHKDARARATLGCIVGEAWARTGQARKAIELLETFDLDDDAYEDLKPQLLRSLAFAYAWSNKTKQMKQALRKMRAINVQLLMGFVTKKKNPAGVHPRGVHPILEKEAYNMVMKSGSVPRRLQVKRM
jgi:hypothetical protein